MSFQNLVRLSQMKKKSLSDYAHVNKVSKKRKKPRFMSYNIMIGCDLYDRFTMEHFPLYESMILTTSFFLPATMLAFVVYLKNNVWSVMLNMNVS
jgi:hypothetical protein